MTLNVRNVALGVVICLLVVASFALLLGQGPRAGGSEISYGQLLDDVDAGKIQSVMISGQEVSGSYVGGGNFSTHAPNDPGLVPKLQSKGVQITARPPSDKTPWLIQLALAAGKTLRRMLHGVFIEATAGGEVLA